MSAETPLLAADMQEEAVAAGRSISQRTAIGAGWLVGFRMFTRTLGVASTLVLARILVPGDFGLIAMATAFSAGVDSLSQIGVQDALVRRPENDQSLFDTAFTLQALRGLVTGCIIAAGATTVAHWFGERRLIPVLLVLAATSASNGLENVGIIEFRRSLRYHYQFMLQAVPRIAGVFTTITMAFVLRSYWALLAGIIVSTVARLATSYALHPFRPRLSLHDWRKLAGFSFWLWLTSLAALVWDRCDPFILGPALGTAALGLYLLAYEVATLPLTELVQPAADVLFAGFSAAHKEGTDPVALALPVATTLLLIVAPLAIGLSAGSGYVVSAMLGTKWQSAQPLIYVLAILCVFSPFAWVSSTALVARGYVRTNFVANATASVMKIAILAGTVAYAGSLEALSAAAVAVMALEAAIFLALLARSGGAGFGQVRGALVRIASAAVVTVLAADATGLAWKPVHMTSFPALAWAGLLCGFIATVYAATELGLWAACGRPEGPESRLLGIAGGLLDPFMARIPPSLLRRLGQLRPAP